MSKNIYPKSINNRQCIGPCYKPGQTIIHPINLQYIDGPKDFYFCPVRPYEIKLPNGKEEIIAIDQCDIKTSKKDSEIIEMPVFDLNCESFLQLYYNIYSFDDMLSYLIKNNHIPYFTKKRLINCGAKSFNKEIFVFNNDLLQIFINISKKNWCEEIYKNINKYIKVINKKEIKLGKKTKNDINDFKEIKKMFISKKFLNENTMYKFFNHYLNKDNIKENNDDFVDNVKENFIKYIIKKIENTIN